MRRLPRSGAVFQRPLRRSAIRRREGSDGEGGPDVHGLSRHHEREQHARQRRLHHRGAVALSVRVQLAAGAALRQRAARESEAVAAQADLPEAVSPDDRVLFRLPQGAHPERRDGLQGVPARAESLRQLHPERRVGRRRPQLLLSGESAAGLQRLPHAARGVRGLWCAALRRRGWSERARSSVCRGQYRPAAAAR